MDILINLHAHFPVIIPYLIGGAIAGFVSGLLGVGGGWLYVPLSLYVLGTQGYHGDIAVYSAVATSLVVIIFTASRGAYAHMKKGAVRVDLLKKWIPFIVLGGITGGMIAEYFSGNAIKFLFGLVLFNNGIRMIILSNRDDNHKSASFFLKFPNWFIYKFIPFAVGLVASLIGIGGGVLSIPIMQGLKINIRDAIGTATTFNIILALPASIIFIIQGIGVAGRTPFSLGYVNLAAVPLLVSAGFIFVNFGVRFSHHLPTQKLKRVFGGFLILVSTKMMLSAFGIG